jgi:hypothetical protein
MTLPNRILSAVPPQMDGFADIEGPVFAQWPLWLGVIAGLLLLLVVLFLLRRLRGRKALSSAERAAPPPEPPLSRALRRLDGVEAGLDRYEAEPLCVAVSDIVRAYLEAVLDLPVREQTSEEFLEALRHLPGQPPVLNEQLPRFLEQCDIVKFARQDLNVESRRELTATARRLVEETDRGLSAPESAPEPATSS